MSDMSSLSHEYASAADFSRHMNEAVLLLKKRFLVRSDLTGVPEESLENAVELLKAAARTVLHRLGEELDSSAGGEMPIPEDVLVRIESRFRADSRYVEEDLNRVLGLLGSNAALSTDDLDLLDAICEAADASASATFRKPWRR